MVSVFATFSNVAAMNRCHILGHKAVLFADHLDQVPE
jgi:hypothetical protein